LSVDIDLFGEKNISWRRLLCGTSKI